MANIWTDTRENNENRGQIFSTNNKQFMSARKHSVKKQAFGELKNVMHNKGGATPFKGFDRRADVFPSSLACTSASLCVDVLRKQQLKQNFTDAQQALEKKLRPIKPEPFKMTPVKLQPVKMAPIQVKPVSVETISIANETDFEDFDVPFNTCSGDCSKSLEEIWGEMNGIDDSFLTKVINGGDPDSDNDNSDAEKAYFRKTDDDLLALDALQFSEERIPTHGFNTDDDADTNAALFEFDMPDITDLIDDLLL